MSKRGYTIRIKDSKIITDEDRVHAQVVQWLRFSHPKIVYRSDPSGELMTDSMRIRQSKVNMPDMSWPDLFLPEARRGYWGIFIEIKKDGERLYKANGLFRSDHLRRQSDILDLLTARNYHATFEIGFDAIIKRITWYLSGPATKIPKHQL